MNSAFRKQLAASPLRDWWRGRQDLRSARAWNAHDDRALAFYGTFLGAGDTAFDIGANIGNRTKVFRRLGARVIALEPQPYCQSILRQAYENDGDVVLVPAAAGRAEGTAEMRIASGHVVSSLSPGWIHQVTRTGRFGNAHWDKTFSCRLTTLDKLIAEYGAPAFIKIDVEGYELEVIEGLHRPVPALSFEFTSEFEEAAFACLDRLDSLGMTQFNYSSGESMELDGAWRGKDEIKAALQAIAGRDSIADALSFGDVYARTARPQTPVAEEA